MLRTYFIGFFLSPKYVLFLLHKISNSYFPILTEYIEIKDSVCVDKLCLLKPQEKRGHAINVTEPKNLWEA